MFIFAQEIKELCYGVECVYYAVHTATIQSSHIVYTTQVSCLCMQPKPNV